MFGHVCFFTSRRLTMHIALRVLAIIATLAPPAYAQSVATGIARDAAQGSKTARLSVDTLCAQLTLDEVTAIMGENFARRPDTEQLFRECKYGDSKDKQRVRFFSLGSNILKEASWRKMFESGGKARSLCAMAYWWAITAETALAPSTRSGSRIGGVTRCICV